MVAGAEMCKAASAPLTWDMRDEAQLRSGFAIDRSPCRSRTSRSMTSRWVKACLAGRAGCDSARRNAARASACSAAVGCCCWGDPAASAAAAAAAVSLPSGAWAAGGAAAPPVVGPAVRFAAGDAFEAALLLALRLLPLLPPPSLAARINTSKALRTGGEAASAGVSDPIIVI